MNRYIATLDSMGFKVSYLPVPKDQRVRVLSKQQMQQLDANVRADADQHCQAMYAILRDTGCRGLVELARVTQADISLTDEPHVVYTSFKGGSQHQRTVPLSEVAAKAFAWKYHYPEGVGEARWRAFWNRVRLDDTNVPYDLRHTFCTRLLDCDVPPPTVMRIMGHTTLDQTLHYQHQRPSALKAARTALQNE